MSHEIELDLAPAGKPLSLAKAGPLRLIWTSMRPHQWVKNLFIFAPLLFGRRLTDPAAVGAALLAFASFCLMASSIYIFNDWVDAEEDRAHPEKSKRPISSGELSVPAALSASAVLSLTALIIAGFIGTKFVLIALAYLLLVISYSLFLKRVLILDGMAIATGFVLRVVGGAVAISVAPSHWLIVCTFLLALLLAFTKRRQEILNLSGDAAAAHRRVLSEYSVGFLDQISLILVGAVIVCYALYTVAPETIDRFGTDALIYGTVFVIYGTFRYLALTKNPSNGENPSRLLLRDMPLLVNILAWTSYNAFVLYYDSLLTILRPIF